jgi:hypothetical protein
MQCGAGDSKLWREYNANPKQTELYCAKCAKEKTGETAVIRPDGSHDTTNGRTTNKIAELIPAIPTAEGTAFWGIKGVPARLTRWWESRPLEKGGRPGSPARKPGELMDLLVEYVKLSRETSVAKSRQEEIKEQVDEGLEQLGVESYASGGYSAQWTDSTWTDYTSLIEDQKLEEEAEKYKRKTPSLRIAGPRQ